MILYREIPKKKSIQANKIIQKSFRIKFNINAEAFLYTDSKLSAKE
jgi:hypothetical protein